MSDDNKQAPLTDENVTEIDRALAAAKAKQAARKGASAAAAPKAPKPAKEPKESKRPRLTDAEKAAREVAKEQAKAEKRTAREEKRAAKNAERAAAKSPAHMKKVARAAASLAPLTEAAQLLFNEATANFTAAQLTSLAQHIHQFNREQATSRSLGATKLEAGQAVRITGGDPRFIGKTGTVTKSQRIRCYVAVEGAKRDVYLFTADVEPVAEAASVAEAS